MGANHILYDRPDLDQALESALGLYVDGTFADAFIGSAYEGRLQIHNSVGNCQVELLTGTLPPGGQVFVDNATHEVVVAWPAYNTGAATLQNPSFETGDITGWTTTTIGGSGTLVASSRYAKDGTYSAYWAGGYGTGNEGGIECYAVNDTRAPVFPNQKINASVDVLYNPDGGTPKGSRGQVRLNWYDVSDNLLSTSLGRLIFTRAYNHVWTRSTISAAAPPDARWVRMGGWVTAVGKDNGHTYFDNAIWDAPGLVGFNVGDTICLTGTVRDSAGRIAPWAGCITINGLGAQFSAWKYKQITASDGTDYSSPSFDDSSWAVGPAPFGGLDGGGTSTNAAYDYDPRFAKVFATAWTPETRLWIRRTLTLAEIPTGGYSMVSYIEDNCHVYINGTLVFDSPDDQVDGSGATTAIAADKFVVGVNSIAVRCDDWPGDAGDSLVYADFLLVPVP